MSNRGATSQAAAALARARAASLTDDERSEIASKAARKRWGTKRARATSARRRKSSK